MSEKVKVLEVAEEAATTSQAIIAKAADLNITLKSANSSLSYDQAEAIIKYIVTGKKETIEDSKETPKIIDKTTKTKITKKNTIDSKILKREDVKKVIKVDKLIKNNETDKVDVEAKKIENNAKLTNENTENKIIDLKDDDSKKKSISKIVNVSNKESNTNSQLNVIKADIKAPRRTGGLKIIKKHKSVKKVNTTVYSSKDQISSTKTQRRSLSEVLGNNQTTQISKTSKPRKEKKKTNAKTHEHGVRLNVGHDIDFIKSHDTLDDDEVMLFDMSKLETSKFLQEQPRKKSNDQTKTTRPSAFGNRPRGLKRGKKKKYVKPVEVKNITEVTIPKECRLYEFAQMIGKTDGDVIGKLFVLGLMVTKNDFLGDDEIEILGEEYGINITIKDQLEEVNYTEDYQEETIDKSNYVPRPPVVTIMGHVDHGKTSLLDKIRSSRVASSESGGITQHISAYTINKNGKEITFIDTPGHEAFISMRKRGAKITDIIIIVVAADDGVKPQTIESIKAAKNSGASIIVAVNKMDKETANLDMVKSSMAEQDMVPSDWGGDIEFVPVSAQTGDGIEDLLENINIIAEVLELQADPTAFCKATILESSIQKGRGPIATIIVQNGILKVGDSIVADTTFGRVKALMNDQGKNVKELGLSCTGHVVGLESVPDAGVSLIALSNINDAKEIANTRKEHARAKELSRSTKVSLDEMSDLIAEGKIKALPIILKADTGGSLEAIKSSLESIKNDEVKVKVLSANVGGITETDLSLANAGENSIIIGFNVRPTGSVKNKAKSDGVAIKTYSIIYQLIDDIKDTLSGMMSAVVTEENTGQANVLDTFVVPKVGTVAGTKVTDGKVIRGGLARVIRDGIVIYTGKIASLKRFKDDVKEVSNGFECGIIFEKFNDIKVNDYIETFIEHKENQTIS